MIFDLYHYYEAEKGPFKNLSALEIDEAEEILQKIRNNGDTFASKRSMDYIKIRKELENKAREAFINKGGKPRNMYPHYMTLGECVWLKEWYNNGKEIKIPMNEFKEISWQRWFLGSGGRSTITYRNRRWDRSFSNESSFSV